MYTHRVAHDARTSTEGVCEAVAVATPKQEAHTNGTHSKSSWSEDVSSFIEPSEPDASKYPPGLDINNPSAMLRYLIVQQAEMKRHEL